MYAEKLMELAGKISEKEMMKEEFTQCINQCFEYVNIAAMTSLQIEMGSGDIYEIERFNDRRNRSHDKLCEALNSINKMSESILKEHMYELELEPMYRNGRFAGYSQNNHHQTSEIASVIIDELQYLGRETYRNMDRMSVIEDRIHQQAMKREFRTQNFNELMNAMDRYNKVHYDIDRELENLKQNEFVKIEFRDGTGTLQIAYNDEYSADIINTDCKDEMLEMYLEDGKGSDIPMSLIRDIIKDHMGYEITGHCIREEEISFDEFLQQAEEQAKLQVYNNRDNKVQTQLYER